MSPYNNDITCSFCGTNMDLVYLCEDCHEVMCDDCLINRAEDQLVCMACGQVEVLANKHGQYSCARCGGQDIRSMKKLTPTCPNCEGHNIIKIADKQHALIEQFKLIIQKTREFLSPLENTVNQLNEYRQMLSRLREDIPKCFHYPTLESDLLIIFKLFTNAKNNLHDQVSLFFQDVQRNLHYITDIPITSPTNLPFIAGIVKNMERECEKLTKSAGDIADPIKGRMEPIVEKLKMMEDIQNLFNLFLGKMNITPEEKIVYGLNCKLSEGNSQGSDVGSKNGTVLLTSKKLYFFHQQGVFNKKSVLLFTVDLNDLQQVGVKGRLKKEVSLEFLNSMYKFSLTKEYREKLIEWIEKARVFDVSNVLDDDNIKKLEKFKLNVKLFREELENAIYQLLGIGSYTNQYPSPPVPSPTPVSNSKVTPLDEFPFAPTPIAAKFANPMNQSPYKRIPTAQNSGNVSYPAYKKEPIRDLDFSPDPYSNPNTYRTPDGHFGFPHDHTKYSQGARNGYSTPKIGGSTPNSGNGFSNNIPPNYNNTSHVNNARRNGFQNSYPNPISGIAPAAGFPNYPSNANVNIYPPQDFTEYDTPISDSTPNYNRPQTRYPPNFNPPSPMGSPNPSIFNHNTFNNNEETRLRNELYQLQQDEFGLIQTIKMLEQRFDGGSMENVDFVKNYREMQKQFYQVQERIKIIQGQLKSEYDLPNN